MIKRINNVTCGILAAVSAVSLIQGVPVTAAEIKKVQSKDGVVYNAIAYKGGKYFIDGDLEGMNEDVYYASNGKYSKLNHIDSGDLSNIYGEKYVEIENGDYYLDLETGKVTDDNIREDDFDDASSALRKKIKKDESSRYADCNSMINYQSRNYEKEKDGLSNGVLSKVNSQNKISKLYAIDKLKFGDEWYIVQYDVNNGYNSNGSEKSFTIYTDKNGNYIDADYNLGRISFTTSKGNASLNNTDDKDAGAKISIHHIKTIGSDKNNIYRLAALRILSDDDKNTNITKNVTFKNSIKGANITTSSAVGYSENSKGDFILVIQKISKAQSSDDIDDAKYAKNVTTYFLTNEEGSKSDKGLNAAYNSDTKYTISNGKVIAYIENESDKNVQVYAYTLKSKNGYYYTDVSDGDDIDVEIREGESDFSKLAVDTDIDGNLYALNRGYVYKFNNDDKWNKLIKVDGSCTDLSVYDENNIIVWNEDDEIYSVSSEKSFTDDKKDNSSNTPAKNGWIQDGTNWYFYNNNNKVTGWVQSPASGLWYYMDKSTGVMKTNCWIQDGANWYYLKSNGVMATGWIYDGHWYYLNPISDGTRGAMKTGWIYTGGKWYYLNPISDGTKGAMKTGWIKSHVSGKWYYLYQDGSMAYNTVINGYKLNSSGAWIK